MYKLLLKYNYHFNIQNHSFQLLYLYILFYIPFIYKSEPIQKRLSQIKIQLNLYYSFPLPKATFHFWRSQTITSPQVTLHLCEANLSPHHRWPFTFAKQTITSPQVTFHFWRSQTITSPQVTFHLDVVD